MIKKEYIDMETFRNRRDEGESLVIHPIPIMTCSGNGRGGGDYQGINMDLVGSWANDIVSLEKTIPKGFKLLDISFKENWEAR